MFRCNYEDLGNCNISCTLCSEPDTGNPHGGRLITHSNNMDCAAHVTCVLERLGNSNDPACPTCNFPVNPPKALSEKERQEKLQEHSYEVVDPELDEMVAQHLAAEVQFEDTSRDAELARLLQEQGEVEQPALDDAECAQLLALQRQFNEEPQQVAQPRNPCLRRLTMTQAVWLAVAVVVAARLALRF